MMWIKDETFWILLNVWAKREKERERERKREQLSYEI